MAWDWVSPASTAAVGIAAIIGGNWASARSRKHDRVLTEDRQEHERQAAQEQWIRGHRNDAYLALLDFVEQAGGLYVQRVRPAWMSALPDAYAPELPTYEQQQRVRARVIAYGSRAVKDQMDEWTTIAWQAIHAASDVEGDAEVRKLMRDLRDQERVKRKALGELVAAELQEAPSRKAENRRS